MSKVELRFTKVEPPAPEPKHTVYTDLVNLPDPVKLGLSPRIFNHDDITLYMRVDGYATGWTFTTNDLGSVASGANTYKVLDNFGTRAKPATETTETITVRLRAYTDSGYTVLKWTYERTITLVFIKSDDPAYTVDVLNNFDDGTVQGWAVAQTRGTPATGYPTIGVGTGYVLSSPYSLYMGMQSGSSSQGAKIYKTFTTPDKPIVYAIIDLRTQQGNAHHRQKTILVKRDTIFLVQVGMWDTAAVNNIPTNKWIRIVVPLPRNVTFELSITWERYDTATGQTPLSNYIMDDFKIISK